MCYTYIVTGTTSVQFLTSRGEKKVICNKIILQSAVTCLWWPVQQSNFVFGLADGKIKIGGAKGSKSQTVYAIDSYTVSLASRLALFV